MKKKKAVEVISLPPIARDKNLVVHEETPLPYVHYPGISGTFIAFSQTQNTDPVLCECCIPSLENYLHLRRRFLENSAIKTLLAVEDFPGSIYSKLSIRGELSALQFQRNICHRCNIKPPSHIFDYATYVFGSKFFQDFGWYIKQMCLRFGIYTDFKAHYDFLEEKCPNEYQVKILGIQKARQEMFELDTMMNEIKHKFAESGERYPYSFWVQDTKLQKELRKKYAQITRGFSKDIENLVREEFGFKKVGEAWISETLLYNIVKSIFPEDEVYFHYRPDWLKGLEIDVFVPKLNLGFEYQGQQHYHAVKAWGGEKSLIKTQARDKLKQEICLEQGVYLILIEYIEPLTESLIKLKIAHYYPVS